MDNSTKVFVGSIPHTVSEEMVRAEASKFGTVEQLHYKPDTSMNHRGWAFIWFSSRQESLAAIQAIDAKLTFPGSIRPCEARFAQTKVPGLTAPSPNRQRNDWQVYNIEDGTPYYYNIVTGVTQWDRPAELDPTRTMGSSQSMGGMQERSSQGPPGANLFVFHLPQNWTDKELIEQFRPYGTVINARVQPTQGTVDGQSRNRGFGFVSYDNCESAFAAIKGLSGLQVDNKWLKVQLKKGEEHLAPPDLLKEHRPTQKAGMPHMQMPEGFPMGFRPPSFPPAYAGRMPMRLGDFTRPQGYMDPYTQPQGHFGYERWAPY
eukprot:GHVR01101041.1.p1 GENE.GHVR01101041.1~~GHVR01101041.1.p1  ORF type:complete len:332 (+),score=58.96 GHVR01101041.1:43-996(+)